MPASTDTATHDRLYLVTRADLPIGLQAAQAAHAAFAFTQHHPDLVGPWFRDSQFLIVVTVPNERDLIRLVTHCVSDDEPFTLWHEPDLGDQATAVALAPGDYARRLCANLPLLGKPRLEVVA